MKIIIFFPLIFILFSCGTSDEAAKEIAEDPCKDLMYLKLKKMNFSDMTGQEQNYFKQKQKECGESNKVVKKKGTNDFLTVLMVVGLVVGSIIGLGFILGNKH